MATLGYEFYLLVNSKIKFVSPRGHVISYLVIRFQMTVRLYSTKAEDNALRNTAFGIIRQIPPELYTEMLQV